MYLLAILKNIQQLKSQISVSGNLPTDEKVKDLVLSSGFSKYVALNIKNQLSSKAKMIRIVENKTIEPKIAQKVIDFVIAEGNYSRIETQFLFGMLIELMSNTVQHAYNTRREDLEHYWYLFAEKQPDNIKFSFIDTGESIPQTVRKKIKELISQPLFNKDNELIISTVKGDFKRSETNLDYRGKGLPQIYSHFNVNRIQNLHIISNRGFVKFSNNSIPSIESKTINAFRGTLFYWEIPVNSIRRHDYD
jgi:hypothetical protein